MTGLPEPLAPNPQGDLMIVVRETHLADLTAVLIPALTLALTFALKRVQTPARKFALTLGSMLVLTLALKIALTTGLTAVLRIGVTSGLQRMNARCLQTLGSLAVAVVMKAIHPLDHEGIDLPVQLH